MNKLWEILSYQTTFKLELNNRATQTVNKGTQMDFATKSLTEEFISLSSEDEIYEEDETYEEDEHTEISGSSYKPSQPLEEASGSSYRPAQHLEEVITSRQFERDMDMAKEKKFIVFEIALLQLFAFCTQCFSKNSKTTKTTRGSMITIKTTCPNNHKHVWSSQPELCHKPAGNVLTAAAILFSGLNPSKVLRVFNVAGIQMFGTRIFHRIQKAYLFRAIKNNWEAEQNALLLSLKGRRALKLEGDSRCDFPCHCVKYGSYCFLESSVKRIIHLVLVQSNEVKSSNTMELEGLKRGLGFFMTKDAEIACLVTNRHIQIRAYLRKNFPQINHFFDCWHIVKSLKSKINKACRKKPNMEKLLLWSRSIQNHLHWLVSSSGGGNDKLLMEAKWLSILQHINNKHLGHCDPIDECVSSDLTTESKRIWIDEQSPAFRKLKPIVSKLAKDVAQISPGCQTSSVNVFHAVVDQFAPKNTHYTFHSLEARLIMAAMHYNENSQKVQSVGRRRSVFIPKNKYSVRPIMAASSYDYVDKLMSRVIKYASTESYDEGYKKSLLNLGDGQILHSSI